MSRQVSEDRWFLCDDGDLELVDYEVTEPERCLHPTQECTFDDVTVEVEMVFLPDGSARAEMVPATAKRSDGAFSTDAG